MSSFLKALPRNGSDTCGTAPGSASEGQIEPDRQKPTRLGPSPKLQKREKNSARTADRPGGRPGIKPPANRRSGLPRKEVIQPHLPVRLPCYDLAPITGLTLGAYPLTVGTATSGATNFRGLTGGVYKARERIHRCLLISDY